MRCVVAVPGCSPARRDTPTVAPPGSCPLPRGRYQPRGGVAGLDPACLCRRPGQLHLSLVRTRRSGTRACWPRPARRIAWSSWLLVDRRFNRRRYNAARPAEAFAARLREQVDLDALSAELLAVVDQTVAPTRASLWVRPSPSPRPPAPAARLSPGA